MGRHGGSQLSASFDRLASRLNLAVTKRLTESVMLTRRMRGMVESLVATMMTDLVVSTPIL